LENASTFFDHAGRVEDGDTAVYSVLGHKADLLILHIRPTVDELNKLERRFENTRFADFTESTVSHLSVTEIGGYTNEDVENDELSQYARDKLFPDIPDRRYVSFYPMSRKRDEGQNWYTLSLEERERMMDQHRESGQKYAGKIKQLISGSIGMDDWEWGVDLFTDDMKHAKDIVYEMRFDEASSKYSEFGPFYTGIRFPADDLEAFMEGEQVPTDGAAQEEGEDEGADDESIRDELAEQGVYAGQPHGEDVYALVLYSEEEPDALTEEVEGMRGNFEHYDTHVKTEVYSSGDDDDDGDDDNGTTAIVSIWDTQDAAETAANYLTNLSGVTERAGDDGEGFSTMGMFYKVKPDYRDDFVDKFEEVGELLAEMDGHKNTELLVNTTDENDMFIDSRWESKEDAMEFFRGEAFSNTVDWGREVLDGKPRHVFLA
ncbi:MAG: heme-binding protein, partial [Halobacteria archaeon]|nr:heme-binding protein [Halobacteria archaeon]